MKPTVDRLSEDIKKIRGEHEKLRDRVYDIQENDMLQVRRKVDGLESYVKLITKLGPLVVIIATIVLTLLGRESYSVWKAGLEKEIEENVASKYEQEMYRKLDQASYENADIEEMVKLSLAENDQIARNALIRLQERATDRLRREYVFCSYIDVCLKRGFFGKAYNHVILAEREKIFPDGFKFPTTFISSGVSLWIKSLRKDQSSPETADLVKRALESLRMAEKAARTDSYYLDIRRSIRRDVVFYSFFIHLSVDSPSEARESLNEYRGFGEEIDWSEVKNSAWFKLLDRSRRHVRAHLARLCPNAFATSKVNLGLTVLSVPYW